MGVSQETLLQIQLNMEDQTIQDHIIIIKERNNSNESIWKKSSMDQEKDQEENSKGKSKSCNNTTARRRRRSRSNSLILKRRSRRSSSKRIEQRVNTLRNLVPNMNNNNDNHDNDGSCVGSLEQLFTQTADYILSLQTRVRLMKTLVDVLSGPSSSSIDE